MEIAFITNHTCIRAKKQAVALREKGFNVHLIANMISDSHIFKTTTQHGDFRELERVIDRMRDNIDIWHVHNEPNWPVLAVRKVIPDAKIVMDHHDSQYWRTKKGMTVYDEKEPVSFYEEDIADQCADAFVAPSLSCQKELAERTGKEIVFVPSATSAEEMRLGVFGVRGGLCSQGGHVTPEMSKKSGVENWRDYTELYTELRGQVHIFTYSPTYFLKLHEGQPMPEDISEYYKSLGVEVNKLFYNQLIDYMGTHTWNLVGNWWKETPKGNVWDYALPNKLFDGIAAGVPPVVIGCPEAADLVLEHDIGIVIKHPKELKIRWNEHKEKRKNLLLYRDKYAIENYIDPLIDLYKRISNGNSNSDTSPSGR